MSEERADSDSIDFIKKAKEFLVRRHKTLMKEFRELEHLRQILEEVASLKESLTPQDVELLDKTKRSIEVMKKIYGMKEEDL